MSAKVKLWALIAVFVLAFFISTKQIFGTPTPAQWLLSHLLAGMLFAGVANTMLFLISNLRKKPGTPSYLLLFFSVILFPVSILAGVVMLLPALALYAVQTAEASQIKRRERAAMQEGRLPENVPSGKMSAFYFRTTALMAVIIAALYTVIIFESDFAFGNGFLTCFALILAAMLVLGCRNLKKNLIIGLSCDPEYLHIHTRSGRTVHIRTSEIGKIEIILHNGRRCEHFSKYADILDFTTLYGAKYRVARLYTRSGMPRNLYYGTDAKGNRLTVDFDACKALATQEYFPDAQIITNQTVPQEEQVGI